MSSSPAPLVLIIDDADSVLKMVTHLLTDAGFRAAVASDGFQGFKMAIEDPPDVILMDIDLPGMDGVEATSHLKRHAATKNIPIIAFTGQTLLATPDRIRARGFSDIVPKTSDGADLVRTIRRVLEER